MPRRNQRSAEAEAWRGLYKTARWQRLRQQVFIRDLYTCQKTGILLSGKHPAPNSPVADHIKEHKGDPVLFWDMDNIQTVSKAYHDSTKQQAERIGYSTEIGADGWPADPQHPANR